MHHIAFVGGGSGGHVMPIAALIQHAQQDTEIGTYCKLFRFGEKDSLEQHVCASYPEVDFIPLFAGKWRRYLTREAIRKNIRDVFRVVVGFFQACVLLKKHHITAVFCKGGYVAMPVSIAAYIWRIPIILHESDTHVGLTNRVVSKMSRQTFLGFPGVISGGVSIGQLLSPRLLSPDMSFVSSVQHNVPTILVTGGSQGASTIFNALLTGLSARGWTDYQFVILLGTKNIDFSERFKQFKNCICYEFIDKPEYMAALYTISDIAITRGSATSLAEQHVFGLKKIIIPLPYTGGNHQRHNGVRYRDTYGDLLITQDDSLSTSLAHAVSTLHTYKKPQSSPDTPQIYDPLTTVRSALLK